MKMRNSKLYFKSLDRLREVVGNRTSISFDNELSGYESFGKFGEEECVYLIYDYETNKKIIKSDDFMPYDFITPAFKSSKREVYYSNKFAQNTPLFMKLGDKHSKISLSLKKSYKKCTNKIKSLDTKLISEFLLKIISNKKVSSNYIAKLLSGYFTEFALEEITGCKKPIKIEYLNHISFLSVIPTPLFIRKAENCLAAVNSLHETKTFSIEKFTAFNTLLVMGLFPTQSTLTALLNHYFTFISVKNNNEKLKSSIMDFKFSNVTPLNFTVRIVEKNVKIDDIPFTKNNIVYSFLGEFSKCPFSNLTSMPFGIGKHKCPGQPVAQAILDKTKEALLDISSHNLITENNVTTSNILKNRPDVALAFE